MDEVFVFGSNLAGRHGKGAAKFARDNYDAKYGVGFGWTSYTSYAIPTKDKNLQSLTVDEIRPFLCELFDEADFNKERVFLLTPIGCGLAGHNPKEIRDMIQDCSPPNNVVLHTSWLNYI